MDALLDDCSVDVGSLLVQWKKFDDIWWGTGFCSSQNFHRDLSILEVDEGSLSFCAMQDLSTHPRTVSWGMGLSWRVTFVSPGVDWAPSQLAPSPRRGDPRACGGSVESAQLSPLCPVSCGRWGVGDPPPPSLSAFLVLRGSGEPLDQPPPLTESDSMTTPCLNCGDSTTFPLGMAGVGSPASELGSSTRGAASPVSESAQCVGQVQVMEAARAGAVVCVLSGPTPVRPSGRVWQPVQRSRMLCWDCRIPGV